MAGKKSKMTLYAFITKRAKALLKEAAAWKDSSANTPNESELLQIGVKRLHFAESLVCALEVYNCGSIGGFDKGQPADQRIKQRIAWLEKKAEAE
jgi:hypothetical protein